MTHPRCYPPPPFPFSPFRLRVIVCAVQKPLKEFSESCFTVKTYLWQMDNGVINILQFSGMPIQWTSNPSYEGIYLRRLKEAQVLWFERKGEGGDTWQVENQQRKKVSTESFYSPLFILLVDWVIMRLWEAPSDKGCWAFCYAFEITKQISFLVFLPPPSPPPPPLPPPVPQLCPFFVLPLFFFFFFETRKQKFEETNNNEGGVS